MVGSKTSTSMNLVSSEGFQFSPASVLLKTPLAVPA